MEAADSSCLDRELIERLRGAIDSALSPILESSSAYALIDFPDHSNVGDSAIWLGEIAWLEAHGSPPPAYVCTCESYNAAELRSSLPEGLILIHGGGNFGDLWPRHQALREQVCRDFPDRRIIQLPQSVYFDDLERAVDARSAFSAHANVTILARDHQSAARMEDFGCHVVLCPDMAFYLSQINIDIKPDFFITTLFRDDKESSDGKWAHRMLAGIHNSDWLAEDSSALRTLRIYLAQKEGRVKSYNRVAEYRLARGISLLCRGDRLHAHIICLLMGKHHLMVDNIYGKIGAFFQSWTSGSSLASMASAPETVSAWLRSQEARIMGARDIQV